MEEQKRSNKAPLTLVEKRERRIKKYAEAGQYRNGVYFCKGGKPIDEDRVRKYEALCHKMANKYCPRQSLFEAAFDYEDLINQCRMEVFLALLNGFDPVKAMGGANVEWKSQNREEALNKAEYNIVFGRLKNYFRRTLWRYHPDQYGGSSTSYDEICEGINQEYRNEAFTVEAEPIDETPHSALLESLFTTLRNRGKKAAKEKFMTLEENEKERILSLLKERASG